MPHVAPRLPRPAAPALGTRPPRARVESEAGPWTRRVESEAGPWTRRVESEAGPWARRAQGQEQVAALREQLRLMQARSRPGAGPSEHPDIIVL